MMVTHPNKFSGVMVLVGSLLVMFGHFGQLWKERQEIRRALNQLERGPQVGLDIGAG